jgi:hypothetical protein
MSFSEAGCTETVGQIPLYVYGEISSEAEERVEAHLAACADCRGQLAAHRAFLEVVDRREEFTDPALLAACRADLRRQLAGEGSRSFTGWFEKLRSFSRLHIPFRVPVGAMALVLLGWFGARVAPEKFGGVSAGVAEPMFSNVRSVEPDSSGKVQIAVDDVRRHVVVGNLQDPRIQALLLAAVREESNPGVRGDSIGVLQNSNGSEEVRNALIEAVTHDPNPGVRLKAIGGLKQYAGDASVRKALAEVLSDDDDPGMRVQAIDLLTAHHDESIVGVLQDVVQKEDNNYIRTRCRNLLEAMKASVGTY